MIDFDDETFDVDSFPDHEAQILETDERKIKLYANGDMLPAIWFTTPVQDSRHSEVHRMYNDFYTGEDDLDGNDALFYGAEYYNEAMTYTNASDHDMRVECFRAAEIFYRHAAGAGNPIASLNLGYIYSYNRCEGNYWRFYGIPQHKLETEEDLKQWEEHIKSTGAIQLDPKMRAFECFKVAAESNVVEAAYKLGDMYKHGTGCTENATEAFKWYARAANLCEQQDEAPVIAGSVALRLAGCFEEGFGCTQSFKDALKWYKQAVLGLDVAVRAGERWYSKALRGARDGVVRCKQELGL